MKTCPSRCGVDSPFTTTPCLLPRWSDEKLTLSARRPPSMTATIANSGRPSSTLFFSRTPRPRMACIVRIARVLAYYAWLLIKLPSATLIDYFAARVRAIFRVPPIFRNLPNEPLLYVEPFRPFSTSTANPHQLFTTSPELDASHRRTARVVPISRVRMTCHLVPKFSEETLASRSYRFSSATDLLSTASLFYLNRHSSHYYFALMEHWRRMRRQQQMAQA